MREDLCLCSEVSERNLLVAVGGDPQSLVLDHCKIVKMSGGHLREKDNMWWSSIGRTMALCVATRVLSKNASSTMAFMTLRALEDHSTQL